MFDQLQSSAQAVWHSGFLLTADDPEERVGLLWRDQLRRVCLATGCDEDVARGGWFGLIARDPMVVTDPREVDSAVCLAARLPERLMRSMPGRAAAFAACFTRIRSGRPWRCEWVVPLGDRGPMGLFVCDIDLSASEFSEVC